MSGLVRMSRIVQVVVLVLGWSVRGVRGVDCPVSCVHGTCLTSKPPVTCSCDPEWVGADCSVPIEICDDGDRVCYNGSECLRNNVVDDATGKYKYHCDCSKAYGVSAFAGHQCEHAATQVCEVGTPSSSYAFCTNGGQCRSFVFDGADHTGCRCAEDFEGVHCQYLKGTAPAGESSSIPLNIGGGGGGGSKLSGLGIFLVTLVCLIVPCVGIAYYLRKKSNQSARNNTMPVVSPADQLEADGTSTLPQAGKRMTHQIDDDDDDDDVEII
jgi:hypothetical protein